MKNNLINPFIIYWDINPSASDNDIIRICNELVEAKIFILDLKDMSLPLSDVTNKILSRLDREQIKIKLTANSGVLHQPMESLKAIQLFPEFNSFKQFQSSLDDIIERINQGYTIGISFSINKTNFSELPAFIASCIANNIVNIRFPIQRADDDEIYYPGPVNACRLSEDLKNLDTGSLDLSIHDPFLWKLFHEEDNPNEDGCNAAKTMMYISRNFDVTPCPIVSVSMGNLCRASLKEIFLSDKRRQIRKDLSTFPDECASCGTLDKCRGGCRGRTYVLFRIFDKKDPACLI